MDLIKGLIFGIFTLGLYSVLVLVAICIILRNAVKVCRFIFDLNSASCKGFFITALTIIFGQLSSIILFNLVFTVAHLYIKEDMLLGLGFYYANTASLFKTDCAGIPLALLVFILVISFFMNVVRQSKAGEIKWYMTLYVFSIAAISCVCTIVMSYFMPVGTDALIGLFYSINPFFGAFIVSGIVLIIYVDSKETKERHAVDEGDTEE